MRWLNKLPNSVRSASGLEWILWRRLPWITVIGTVLPLALGALCAWWWPEPPWRPDGSWEPDFLLLSFTLMGVVVLHWTLVLTVAIGCAIVLLMKGPAYVADAYVMPDSERPAAKG